MTLRCSFAVVEVLSGSRPTDWVHLKGILAQKEPRGKTLKERDHNRFSTCRWMHAISNSRCQINVLFAMIVYGERRGSDMERNFGLWLLSRPREAPKMRHRKRGTSLIILKRTEISCRAEMLRLGQAGAELRSANKLGFCAAVLQYWHPCTAVWKHLLPHLLHKPFGKKLKGIHREEYNWALDLEEISVNLYVFWWSFEP